MPIVLASRISPPVLHMRHPMITIHKHGRCTYSATSGFKISLPVIRDASWAFMLKTYIPCHEIWQHLWKLRPSSNSYDPIPTILSNPGWTLGLEIRSPRGHFNVGERRQAQPALCSWCSISAMMASSCTVGCWNLEAVGSPIPASKGAIPNSNASSTNSWSDMKGFMQIDATSQSFHPLILSRLEVNFAISILVETWMLATCQSESRQSAPGMTRDKELCLLRILRANIAPILLSSTL